MDNVSEVTVLGVEGQWGGLGQVELTPSPEISEMLCMFIEWRKGCLVVIEECHE